MNTKTPKLPLVEPGPIIEEAARLVKERSLPERGEKEMVKEKAKVKVNPQEKENHHHHETHQDLQEDVPRGTPREEVAVKGPLQVNEDDPHPRTQEIRIKQREYVGFI